MACLADVKVDLARRAAHVAEIRVRHFAGAVHDAAHDGDLHALEMLRARLDARGDGLQIEQRPPAARARDVIGLEAAATGGLQNIISQPQRLSAARFAANQNRIANAVRQQRADDDGRAEQGDFRFERHGFKIDAILEQNRIVAAKPLQFRREQAERGDGRQIHAVLHGDKLRLAIDFKILRRVNFKNVQVFVNRFRLHVVFRTDFRRDLVPRRARDDDADQLFAAAFDVFVQFNFRRLALLEMERVERKFGSSAVLGIAELGVSSTKESARANRGRPRFRAGNLP